MLRGHNLRQMLHLVVVGFFLWKLVDHLLVEKVTSEDSYVSYIYLAAYLVGSLGVGFITFNSVVNQ